MAFQGNLQDFGLPDIFQLIAQQSKSGVLMLRRRGEEVRIVIDGGMAVEADSSQRSLYERMGSMLVKVGKLGTEGLQQALDEQRGTDLRLGQILVKAGLVDAATVQEVLAIQLRQILYGVLRWSEGTYDFQQSEVQWDRDNVVPASFQEILMDGMRMIDEWPLLDKRLSCRQTVLHRVPQIPESEAEDDELDSILDVLTPASHGDAAPAAPEPELEGAEAMVYARVDGRATIQDIVESTMLGEFDVCRALYDLWERNLVAPAYEGSLDAIGFTDLLLAIRRTHSTGRLELTRGQTVKTIFFRDGDFMAAESNDPDDSIGVHLFRHGVLTRADLMRVEGLGVDPAAVGSYLVHRGQLEAEELEMHLVRQMGQIVLSLFNWQQGEYRYRPGIPPNLPSVGLERRSAAVVLRGVKALSSWTRLERGVGPADAVYRFLANVPANVQRDLGEEERKILASFAGGRSLADVCRIHKGNEFVVHQMVWAFHLLGFLERSGLDREVRVLMAALSGEALLPDPDVTDPSMELEGRGSSIDGVGTDAHTRPGPEGPGPALAASAAARECPAEEPQRRGGDVTSGTFSGESLADLLRALYVSRRSGMMTTERDGQKKHIVFSHGSAVSAWCSEPENKLGQILIRMGLLSASVVSDLLQSSRRGVLGREIIDRKLLTEEQLSRALETQIREIVLPLFRWGNTTYELEDRPADDSDIPTAGISCAELIMAGVRTLDVSDQTRHELFGSQRSLAPHSNEVLRFQRVRLQPEEGFLLSLLDGKTPVREIVMMSPVDEPTTCRILRGLVSAGLVEWVGKSVQCDPETSRQSRPLPPPELEKLAAVVERMKGMDHFGVLGLTPAAEIDEINAAYRQQSKRYHPDHGRTPREKEHLEEIFARVVEAGKILRDPARLAAYKLQRMAQTV